MLQKLQISILFGVLINRCGFKNSISVHFMKFISFCFQSLYEYLVSSLWVEHCIIARQLFEHNEAVSLLRVFCPFFSPLNRKALEVLT
jgi:hypothetical protein